MRLKLHDRLQCSAMFSAAMASRIGVIVHTSDAMRAKALLYEFRKEAPELRNLQIRFSPQNADEDLWILHGAEPEPNSASTDDIPI